MSTSVLRSAQRAVLLAMLASSLAAAASALSAPPSLGSARGLVFRDDRPRAVALARGDLSLYAPTAPDALERERLARVTQPAELALDTPDGRVYYTGSLEVAATYYTPRDGGKAPGSPFYAITATGARATRGIVAVDPRLIPLYSWLYVPGYGFAQARDVGGGIIGNHIDVAFDDGDGAWWGRRSLTVYVLASDGGRP